MSFFVNWLSSPHISSACRQRFRWNVAMGQVHVMFGFIIDPPQ